MAILAQNQVTANKILEQILGGHFPSPTTVDDKKKKGRREMVKAMVMMISQEEVQISKEEK